MMVVAMLLDVISKFVVLQCTEGISIPKIHEKPEVRTPDDKIIDNVECQATRRMLEVQSAPDRQGRNSLA
jgi:hypothetical protein